MTQNDKPSKTSLADLFDSISRLSQNDKRHLCKLLEAELVKTGTETEWKSESTAERQLSELQEPYTVAAYGQGEAMEQTIRSFPVQFITESDGERVGVVLAWEDYSLLRRYAPADPELLAGLNKTELEALSDSMLAPARQNRLSRLLHKKKEGLLGTDEVAELDHTLEQIDQLNLLKARAILTLQQFSESTGDYLEL